MTQPIFLTLIFPAYNEVKTIAQTIAEAQTYLDRRGFSYEIIVSADGTDGTRELMVEMAQTDARLRVIGSPERRGKGYGIRQAVFLAKGQIVGFADADNKTPIAELDKFLPWFEQGYDLVIGSRGLADSYIENPQLWYRQIGSRGFGIFMHLVMGLHDIIDTQCGFKFFRREVALDLFRRQQINGYMYDVEILYLARQAGYRLQQVGIRWRDDGDSRLVLLGGNIRNALDVLSIRFNVQRKDPMPQFSGQRVPVSTEDV
jgi:dolichyl-phosphate beta-glucosyltransferase